MSNREAMERAEEELVSFLDGELDDGAAVAFAERLAGSETLRSDLRAQARLRRLTAELPREIEPQRDLFPQIAARLEPRQAAVRRGPWGRRTPAFWRQALAAMLGVALGMTLTFAVLTGSKTGPVLKDPAGDSVVAERPTAGIGAVAPASLEDAAASARIEADFLRARESLWIELLARRQQLPPETWQAVVENLGLLDRVIRELRHALDGDPGNRRLERLLLSNHQRQLDVLHRVTREV